MMHGGNIDMTIAYRHVAIPFAIAIGCIACWRQLPGIACLSNIPGALRRSSSLSFKSSLQFEEFALRTGFLYAMVRELSML